MAREWQGKTVVCIASGPSVTRADCERVKAWRESSDNHRVVVVNSMFMWCPWADALFAMDRVWWDSYLQQVRAEFKGRTYAWGDNIYDVTNSRAWHYQNSGAGAVSMAFCFGAKKIILLGYDLQLTGGKAHCHGDHPKGTGKNASNYRDWPEHFRRLHDHMRMNNPPDIINATPGSRLGLWPKKTLSEALANSASVKEVLDV